MLQEWQIAVLCCPFDRARLVETTDGLQCTECRRTFPVVDGIPSFVAADLATAHEREEWLRKQSEMQARDTQARRYDRLLGLILLSPLEKRLTLRDLKGRSAPFGTLAEIGCGTGRMLQHFAALADRTVGVDFSLQSLKVCRERMHRTGNGDRTLLVHADACFLPIAHSALDAVASCQLVEHLPSERLRQQVIAEIARVLKRGGRYAISGYNWSRLARWSGAKQGLHDGGIYYYRFTQEEFRSLVGASLPVESLRNVLGYVWLASGSKRD